jgi:hypothetical protein
VNLLNRLQRRFGRFALPHVTESVIACQVVVYMLCQTRPELAERIALIPARVVEGEVWRLVTFLCEPPPMNILCTLFFWYLFFLMGTALEATWGVFRYNVYLLVGWLATVAAACLQPEAVSSGAFLESSVFLAFAYLYPNFVLMLFFILPVKVKWLALLQWASYAFVIAFGSVTAQLLATASVLNFFLFFGREIWWRMKSGRRRMAAQAAKIKHVETARHTCSICGATNLSNPKMSFRYCSKCVGSPCYCEEHIQGHAHLVEKTSPA